MSADVSNQIADSASRKLAADLDSALTALIDQRLGKGRWTLEDLRGRLVLVVDRSTGTRTYALDGMKLLEMWEPAVQIVRQGHAIQFVVTQSHRTFAASGSVTA